MSYNGWTNYETWCVNLWAENDEGSYEDWEAACRRGPREAREWIESYMGLDEMGAGLASDLLGNALDSVDWEQICAHHEDEEEDEEEEEEEEE